MTSLTWREATRSDRSALASFRCTTPPTKMGRAPWKEIHPREWELALQREIHKLKPRCNDRKTVLLGHDAAGLAAVTAAEQLTNASEVIIEAVAVALRCRQSGGGGWGDEALQRAVDWAINLADAAGHPRLLLIAKTDLRNEYGQRLLTRNGFGRRFNDDPLYLWYQQQIDL